MTRLFPGVCARPSVAVACTSISCEAGGGEGWGGGARSAGSLGGMLEWSLRSGEVNMSDLISQQR